MLLLTSQAIFANGALPDYVGAAGCLDLLIDALCHTAAYSHRSDDVCLMHLVGFCLAPGCIRTASRDVMKEHGKVIDPTVSFWGEILAELTWQAKVLNRLECVNESEHVGELDDTMHD